MAMTYNMHIDLLLRPERSLILRTLLKNIIQPGMRVLDAGCGSGILSIWAAQFGAKEVVSVDMNDPDLTLEMAAANGVADRITYIQGDLLTLEPSAIDGKFDLIIGMLYFSDPRRDEGVMDLSAILHERYLVEGGKCIPNRFEYFASLYDWPDQDNSSRLQEMNSSVCNVEKIYNLDLSPLTDWALENPPLSAFPARAVSGQVDKQNARIVSEKRKWFEHRYLGNPTRYPDQIELKTLSAGVPTTVVWNQKLYLDDTFIFSNESISWLENPIAVKSDGLASITLDENWRKTNVLKIK